MGSSVKAETREEKVMLIALGGVARCIEDGFVVSDKSITLSPEARRQIATLEKEGFSATTEELQVAIETIQVQLTKGGSA